MKLTKPILSAKKLSIGYHGHSLLDAFDLDIHQGDFLSVVGSNGSGKTTLVRTLLNLNKPLSGQITRDENLRFGYVPQKNKTNLSFPLTVAQVVMLGRVKRLGLFNSPKPKDYEIIGQALKEVAIEKLSSNLIHTLSGGQYQRMLIARALASGPNILVFDEPTTGMDIVAEHNFMELVEDLRKSRGLTVIMVTHDLSSAAQVSDSLLIINSQDRSVSVGEPLEVLTSEKLSNLFHRPLHVVEAEGKLSFIVGDGP